ncbi:MAG: hypothetical protein ABW148_09540 [Sedimenticola sp.]
MLEHYRKHVKERAVEGIPPLPLDPGMEEINTMSDDIYRYLNFDQIDTCQTTTLADIPVVIES